MLGRIQIDLQEGGVGAGFYPAARMFFLHTAICSSIGLVALLVLSEPSINEGVQAVLFTCLLYGLAVEDLRNLQVPVFFVFGGIVLRVGYLALLERSALVPMVLGLFAGAGMLTLVGLAYEQLRGRDGLGAGDAAAMGLIGAFVGWQGLVPVLLGAAVAGLIGGGGALLALRRPLDSPLPFAPFLAAGGWAVYIAQHVGWLPSYLE